MPLISNLNKRQLLSLLVLCTASAIAGWWIYEHLDPPGENPPAQKSDNKPVAPLQEASTTATQETERVITISMDPTLLRRYQEIVDIDNPELAEWQAATLGFNDTEQKPVNLRVRGSSSKRFARKSYHIDLLEKREIWPNANIKRLYAINLGFDPYSFKVRFANTCLNALGLFPAHNKLMRMRINGIDQGIYLLVERPRNSIRRVHDNIVVIFRANRSGYERRWTKPDVDSPRRITKRISAALAINDHADRAAELTKLLDIDAFTKWMACNSLLQNADTIDELFLYEQRTAEQEIGVLGVMGWDYDDLGAPASHPELVLEHPLTYACESPISKCILTTPLLLTQYRAALQEVLTGPLTDTEIKTYIAQVHKRLREIDPVNDGVRQQVMKALETKILQRRELLIARLKD
jgi:hypothetical protein